MSTRKQSEINIKKRKRRFKIRISFIMILIIFTLGFVGIFKVISIKANNGKNFEQSAIENQINKVQDKIISPNRGTVLDRNNQALAISSSVFNVALDLRNIFAEDEEKKSKLIQIVSESLDIEYAKLMAYFEPTSEGTLKAENDTHWKIIKKKIPFNVGKELEEKLKSEKLKGVYLEEDSERNYPNKNLASQTIGFIMGDTSWGLENSYNKEMTGIPGRIFRTYENNNYIITRDVEPVKGNNIVTTLDLTIQQFAEKIVENTYKEASPKHTPLSTSIIVMKPKTGEIVAMAQYPNFNLNSPNEISILEDIKNKTEFEKLPDEKKMTYRNNIWKNFSIVDTFEPGSTFKPIVIAAALEEGVINPNDTFYCEGHRTIAGKKVRCHIRAGHGQINVTDILAKSCNLGMIDIVNKLGKEKFYKYQKDFGFGEKTGIDINGEVDASNLMYPLERLNILELATSSFGQGFNSTSLQILNAFASSINGGNLMKPYLVSQIIDEAGNIVSENNGQIVRKVISEDTSDFIRKALVKTVSPDGTAKKAIIEGYSLAGKTGTAQQGKREDNIYTLSFIGYLPAEDPEYIAISVIHKPKDYYTGAISPVPMLKELFLNIIDYKAMSPSNPNVEINKENLSNSEILLKDFSNQSLQKVIKELNTIGLEYQIIGSGGDTVVKHFPVGNTKVSKDGKILLYVETLDKEKPLQIVPDLNNMSSTDAKLLLEEMGFEVYYQEEISDKQAENQEEPENDSNEEPLPNNKKVFKQLPKAGIYIEKGSVVKIMVK